jgi:5-methylthioribose kinase
VVHGPPAGPGEPRAEVELPVELSLQLDAESLLPWLERCGVLACGVPARVEPAGRGNLNFVRRVRPERGPSWVVKQARPHVEGFPEFPLSSERIVFEWRYLRAAAELVPEHAALLPAVRHFDPEARVLVLEDVRDAEGLDALLRAGSAPLEALRRFGALLAAVHATSARRAAALEADFANTEMRRLHGAQLFEAPYAGPVPSLPAELARARERLSAEPALRARVESLAACYASSRGALVHGDAKAPNVLVQGERPRLIDAEFAHIGDPAFDLGVALGHLVLHTAAPSARSALEPARTALREGYGGDFRCSARAAHYAGAVVLAHVVGPSRLAFERVDDALQALNIGRELLLG